MKEFYAFKVLTLTPLKLDWPWLLSVSFNKISGRKLVLLVLEKSISIFFGGCSFVVKIVAVIINRKKTLLQKNNLRSFFLKLLG